VDGPAAEAYIVSMHGNLKGAISSILTTYHPGRLLMPTNTEYEAAIRKVKWPGLQKLWADVTSGKVDPWWPKSIVPTAAQDPRAEPVLPGMRMKTPRRDGEARPPS
jgi:hypothetical protein